MKPIEKARKQAKKIASQVRKACKENGLTQTKLATITGLSRPTVIRIWHGDPKVSLHAFVKVCKALGLELTINVQEA